MVARYSVRPLLEKRDVGQSFGNIDTWRTILHSRYEPSRQIAASRTLYYPILLTAAFLLEGIGSAYIVLWRQLWKRRTAPYYTFGFPLIHGKDCWGNTQVLR